MLIDTHCHLNHERFDGEADEALARAREAGVSACIVIGYDLPSSERAVELAAESPEVFAAVGVHPHDASTLDAPALERIRELSREPKVVAIGEIGLDFYRDLSPRDEQARAFRQQLALAADVGLPVVIHTRESVAETLQVLAQPEFTAVTGVLHCWSGSLAEANRAVELGYYLGVGGVVTFKNADSLRDVVRAAPADRLLLETDAPYLAPVPRRGKRNEPAYVAYVAAKVAEVLDTDQASVIRQTGANARRLFPALRAD